jgi:3-hydroxyisobutyrate dehydrogenase
MSDRIGFIGLGIMGRPMARNLLGAGYPVAVWNRSRPPIKELAKDGATAASSPREVAEHSDVVITMVTDSPDVEQVILGPDGIIENARRGLVVIDMSTISPDVTRHIAAQLAEKEVEMLDAPVSGGEHGAIAGTLSIMVGGHKETFERCRPILEVLGHKLVYCGPSGSGQTVKLCNQIVVALNNLAMCEALVFAVKAGIDPDVVIDAVSAGAGSSWAIQNLAPMVVQRDFRAGFRVAHQQKDLRLALEAAGERFVPLPGTSLVHQLFAAIEAEGLGTEGTQSLVMALEKLADVEVKG